MLEFENIYELDVTHDDLKVLKKVNDPELLVQCQDQSFVYKEDDLEYALFCVISGQPTVLCFRKINIELIQYINGKFVVEFRDQKCVYLYHTCQHIYLFNEKIEMYMKYGSKQDCTYHKSLITQNQAELYFSEDEPDVQNGQLNLGRVVTMYATTFFQGLADGFDEFSHLTLALIDDFYYRCARCRIECEELNGNISYDLEWNYLIPNSKSPTCVIMTPHIVRDSGKYYAIIANNRVLLSLPILSAWCSHSWHYNNYLYISDKHTRVFGFCHHDNICHLIEPLRKHTCFLIWCLHQQTPFNDRSYKYYLPIRLFIDCLLTSVLMDVKY